MQGVWAVPNRDILVVYTPGGGLDRAPGEIGHVEAKITVSAHCLSPSSKLGFREALCGASLETFNIGVGSLYPFDPNSPNYIRKKGQKKSRQ
jgi:hypothetical protein